MSIMDVITRALFAVAPCNTAIGLFSLISRQLVVLGDFKTIKEGFVTLGTQMAGRSSIDGPFGEILKSYSTISPTMGTLQFVLWSTSQLPMVLLTKCINITTNQTPSLKIR